jgi:UDP-N-acetylglucosamine--N-acetylmuramyl-(pentapeptide) pyrophosphoryl-undecaprenol N-acetylglucosamine transferase
MENGEWEPYTIEQYVNDEQRWYAENIEYYAENGNRKTDNALVAPCTLHPAPCTVKLEFIDRMDYAFAIADVVVSRAGAGTISELCIAGKACVFVPSPNVAEDHQTKNAQALVAKNAALMVADSDAPAQLIPTVLELLQNDNRKKELERNIAALAKPNAANEIVDEIMKLVNNG